MKIWRNIKFSWRILKAIWRGDPVRSWRKTVDGRYCCDGDCGRWSMHGVCTCGITHYLKFEGDYHDKINRDNVSWRREGTTEQYMMEVPYQYECTHGIHLNLKCQACEIETEKMMKWIIEELQKPKNNERSE